MHGGRTADGRREHRDSAVAGVLQTAVGWRVVGLRPLGDWQGRVNYKYLTYKGKLGFLLSGLYDSAHIGVLYSISYKVKLYS